MIGCATVHVTGTGPADLAQLVAAARSSPLLRRLFTPAIAPPGAYEVYVTDRRLEMVVDSLHKRQPAADGWSIETRSPLEAFGTAGRHEPWRLLRLFGGASARVARGPVTDDGRLVAAVTLLSPYPDPSFTRLWPGTMIIVFRPEKWK